MKRDPHLFDLVIFLHPKKCLTCGREKFALLLVLETVHQHDGAPNFERTAQMPAKAKTTAGGNALAKGLAYLTVADNEAEKPEELGLGAAQAQEEDARRTMAEKRKESQMMMMSFICSCRNKI